MCVTYVQKNFWIRASIKKLLTKYEMFTILPQISHFHKFRNFSSIFATFETNFFIPINFMAGTCQEYSFFIFASCHPLKCLFGTVTILTFLFKNANLRIKKTREKTKAHPYFPIVWVGRSEKGKQTTFFLDLNTQVNASQHIIEHAFKGTNGRQKTYIWGLPCLLHLLFWF